MNITNTMLISATMDFLFIFIFSLLGAIVKDTYNTLTEKDTKVKISRIFVSTAVSTVIIFGLSDYILTKLSLKMFILPCFIGGMVGFDSVEKLTSIDFWVEVYNRSKR